MKNVLKTIQKFRDLWRKMTKYFKKVCKQNVLHGFKHDPYR